jgi:hypothetical protein
MDRRTEDTFRTEMFSCASGSGEFMTTLYNNENSVIQFKINLKSKMAVMASNWPKHFRFLLKNCCMWSQETCRKCFSVGLRKRCCLFKSIRNPAWLPQLLIGWDIFTFFQNYFIWIDQNCHRCSSRGSEEVLLLFLRKLELSFFVQLNSGNEIYNDIAEISCFSP